MSRITFKTGRPGLFVLTAAFSLAALAGAQALQVTAEQRAACTPDAMRLCSSEIPDVARVTACMKAHRASLSAGCQAAFTSASENPAAAPREHVAAIAPHPRVHAVEGHVSHHHRYASAQAYGYRHHHHRGYGAWGQNAEAMAIARQVMGGLAMACGNGSVPPDVCSMSGNIMSSMGGMRGSAAMSPY